jgi:hypothetical protein
VHDLKEAKTRAMIVWQASRAVIQPPKENEKRKDKIVG